MQTSKLSTPIKPDLDRPSPAVSEKDDIPKDVSDKALELKESLQKKLEFIKLARGYVPPNQLEPIEAAVSSALKDLDSIINSTV